MLTNTHRRSHARGNTVVPYGWQATRQLPGRVRQLHRTYRLWPGIKGDGQPHRRRLRRLFHPRRGALGPPRHRQQRLPARQEQRPFKNCSRSSTTANRFHAFYPGMVNFEGSCTENLVGANHFLRQMEPFDPLKPYNNGLDDLFGLVHIAGCNNTVTGNHFSYDVPGASVNPSSQPPTIILVASGSTKVRTRNRPHRGTAVCRRLLDRCSRSHPGLRRAVGRYRAGIPFQGRRVRTDTRPVGGVRGTGGNRDRKYRSVGDTGGQSQHRRPDRSP